MRLAHVWCGHGPCAHFQQQAAASGGAGAVARLRGRGAAAVLHAGGAGAEPDAIVDQPPDRRARAPGRQGTVRAPHARARTHRRRHAAAAGGAPGVEHGRPMRGRAARRQRRTPRDADHLCLLRLAVAGAAAGAVPACASRHRDPARCFGPAGEPAGRGRGPGHPLAVTGPDAARRDPSGRRCAGADHQPAAAAREAAAHAGRSGTLAAARPGRKRAWRLAPELEHLVRVRRRRPRRTHGRAAGVLVRRPGGAGCRARPGRGAGALALPAGLHRQRRPGDALPRTADAFRLPPRADPPSAGVP